MPINHEMKVASAQVKSCILLASLCVNGQTKIIEPVKCRDHTEIMMRSLGLKIKSKDISHSSGSIGTEITFNGFQEFDGRNFEVPGDISSAAFLIVAALIIKDSKILIKNIGLNPLRDGILTTLLEMGGNISLQNEREVNGEKIADILVEYSQLKAVDVPASRAASMIDEYPILSIASANAKGITKMNGIGELKVKESNRLLMIANGLEACGVKINMGEDFLEVQGGIEQKNNIIKIQTALDHRIAMSFLIMGLKMENGIEIDDSKMIKTSFPNFENIFANMKNNFSS
jgi:3-phosphoshikimate 1-carboxyvinyltransferase